MKQIKMLKTSTGAVNGLWVKTFLADSAYDIDGESIDDDLASVFIRDGKAEKVNQIVSAAEEKYFDPVIENKMITPVIKNKGKK